MGHTYAIHCEFDRLPQSTPQLVKMGALIMRKETGISLKDIETLDDVENEQFITLNDNEEEDNDEKFELESEPLH